MPTITDFYGMHIYMNFIQHEHNPPHIHVSYGDYACIIDFQTCSVISGKLPPRAMGMALEWTAKYQEELLDIWTTQKFRKLPPLD